MKTVLRKEHIGEKGDKTTDTAYPDYWEYDMPYVIHDIEVDHCLENYKCGNQVQ